jgi:hypothetical protein
MIAKPSWDYWHRPAGPRKQWSACPARNSRDSYGELSRERSPLTPWGIPHRWNVPVRAQELLAPREVPLILDPLGFALPFALRGARFWPVLSVGASDVH